MPQLDYAPRFDERSRNYRVDTTPTDRVWRYWAPGPQLDQGAEGACVGHAVMASLTATPQRADLFAQPGAFGIYKLAQFIDRWAGEDYEGTSLLAGAQVAHKAGLISAFRWCFGVDDVKRTVLEEGPVMIGVEWHRDMYEPLEGGLLSVTGPVVGGHAILITGYSSVRDMPGHGEGSYFKLRNSWGSNYGENGSCFLSEADLVDLLDRRGEACRLVQT